MILVLVVVALAACGAAGWLVLARRISRLDTRSLSGERQLVSMIGSQAGRIGALEKRLDDHDRERGEEQAHARSRLAALLGHEETPTGG